MLSLPQPLSSRAKQIEGRLSEDGESSDQRQRVTDFQAAKAKSQSWLFLLILVALSANIFYPGEIFFQSKYLLISVALLAGLFVSISGLRSPDLQNIAEHLIICFAPFLLILPSFYTSINSHRTMEAFLLFFSFACLVFYLRVAVPTQAQILLAIVIMALVAFVVDLFCVYQYFFGLSKLKSLLTQADSMDPDFRSALLTRVSSRRVFGNFSLPNSLAGFVCMMLPVQLYLAYLACPSAQSKYLAQWSSSEALFRKISRWPLIRIALAFQIALSLVVLALTQSFGGWACFLVSMSLLSYYWTRIKNIPLRALFLPLILFALTICAWILWISKRRGFGLLNFSVNENPIVLRWLNFKVALSIFRDFPWSGVGLGNYGTINPVYQQTAVNVTQYTHNSFLQLLSECGMPFLVFGLFVTIILARDWLGKMRPNRPDLAPPCLFRIILLISLSAWFVHNLIDINLYFPSLGGLGVFLSALYLVQTRPHNKRIIPGDIQFPAVLSRTLLLVLAISITILEIYTAKSYYAQTLAARAIEQAESKDFQEAEASLERAIRMEEKDASLFFLYSNLKLKNSFDRGKLDQAALLDLKKNYQRATELDPYNSEYHFQLSKILTALGEREASSLEKRRAQALFPAESRYRH